jgi:hypothetical protein
MFEIIWRVAIAEDLDPIAASIIVETFLAAAAKLLYG